MLEHWFYNMVKNKVGSKAPFILQNKLMYCKLQASVTLTPCDNEYAAGMRSVSKVIFYCNK
jgi:hypothetical protein